MIISIQREKTFHPKCCRTVEDIEQKKESEVEITYKVPTAEDFENFVQGKLSDTEVYRKSILKIKGLYRSDTNKEVTERELPTLPGSRALISEISKKVLNEYGFTLEEKN